MEGLELGTLVGQATREAAREAMLVSAVPEIAAQFAKALHRCDQLLTPLAAEQLHGLSLLLACVQAGNQCSIPLLLPRRGVNACHSWPFNAPTFCSSRMGWSSDR